PERARVADHPSARRRCAGAGDQVLSDVTAHHVRAAPPRQPREGAVPATRVENSPALERGIFEELVEDDFQPSSDIVRVVESLESIGNGVIEESRVLASVHRLALRQY